MTSERPPVPRRYYHQRPGAQPPKLDLDAVKKLVAASYGLFLSRDYFQEAFGYRCVDDGFVTGSCGEDIAGWIQVNAWLDNVHPIHERITSLDEPTLFAVIELLWDLVSAPLKDGARHHTYSGCGWHYVQFDKALGQQEWRTAMNKVLDLYGEGFELSEQGEVQRIGTSPSL